MNFFEQIIPFQNSIHLLEVWYVDNRWTSWSIYIRNSFSIVAAICGGQSISANIGVLFIQCENKIILSTHSTLWLCWDLMQKVVQIKAFGIQSKTKIHQIDGRQLTVKNSGEDNANFYFCWLSTRKCMTKQVQKQMSWRWNRHRLLHAR